LCFAIGKASKAKRSAESESLSQLGGIEHLRKLYPHVFVVRSGQNGIGDNGLRLAASARHHAALHYPRQSTLARAAISRRCLARANPGILTKCEVWLRRFVRLHRHPHDSVARDQLFDFAKESHGSHSALGEPGGDRGA
jgi:hypothetical protein